MSGDSKDRPSKRAERNAIDLARARLKLWEPVMKPEGPPNWFEGAKGMPAFDPGLKDFSPSNAWWLSELCRIAYTPDGKEAGRPWHRDKPSRYEFIESHTPFRETLNLHKTGNHMSLYRIADGSAAILCFRGTNKLRQWIMNLTALPARWTRESAGTSGIYVHRGFQTLFNRVWPLIEPSLFELDCPVVFTGHSLGAAFATLAAATSSVIPAALYTFGSPRVGNAAFAGLLAGITHHRVVNHHDIVAQMPLNDPLWADRDYRHAGRAILLGRELGQIDSGHSEWVLENPLSFLAASLGQTEPPEWVLDHLPLAYSQKLRALADHAGPGPVTVSTGE